MAPVKITVNDAIEAALSGPYSTPGNDCFQPIGDYHGIDRGAHLHIPYEDVIVRFVKEYGSVLAGYEGELARLGFVRVDGGRLPGDAAVIEIPAPLFGTLGIVDESCAVRYRIGERLMTLTGGHRLASLWRR